MSWRPKRIPRGATEQHRWTHPDGREVRIYTGYASDGYKTGYERRAAAWVLRLSPTERMFVMRLTGKNLRRWRCEQLPELVAGAKRDGWTKEQLAA